MKFLAQASLYNILFFIYHVYSKYVIQISVTAWTPEIQADTDSPFCRIWRIFMPECHLQAVTEFLNTFLNTFLESIWQMEKIFYINQSVQETSWESTNFWGVPQLLPKILPIHIDHPVS